MCFRLQSLQLELYNDWFLRQAIYEHLNKFLFSTGIVE